MKRYSILALTLVLGASMLCGCRRREEPPMNTSAPTIMPTVEMPTMAPTEATTQPATEATVNTEPSQAATDGTIDENGATGEYATEDTGGVESRTRRIPGGR